MIKVSAPGSMMLFGEHAILAGKTSLSMAINHRLQVSIEYLEARDIYIESALGHYHTYVDNITIERPFHFILAALQHYAKDLSKGLKIKIDSQFSHTLGLGSSAAVTVAMIAALEQLLHQSIDKTKVFLLARHIIQQLQGQGSGADALASTFGGILAYRMEPFWMQALPTCLESNLIYCGYKTPTPLVIQHVLEFKKKHPALVETAFEVIDTVSNQAIAAHAANDLPEVGKLMVKQQEWQTELGLTDEASEKILTTLKQHSSLLGAKISGSGFGDCLWALGPIPEELFPHPDLPNSLQIAVRTEPQGVTCHE